MPASQFKSILVTSITQFRGSSLQRIYIFLGNVRGRIQRGTAADNTFGRCRRRYFCSKPRSLLTMAIPRQNQNEPEHHIAAAIELARFADMCNITGMESQIGRYLKDILIANPCPEYEGGVAVDTYCLTSQHIISASFLPQGHAISRIVAAVTVDGYLFCENHNLAQEAREYPTYGVDLLQEVGLALKGLKFQQYKAIPKDRLTGDERNFYRFRSS